MKNKILSFMLVMVLLINSATMPVSAATENYKEVKGSPSKATWTDPERKFEMGAFTHYYNGFHNAGSTDHVLAALTNEEKSPSTGPVTYGKVWLLEENPGPNPTICSLGESLSNQYVDTVQCDDYYHNKNEDFYANGKYTSMSGNWQTARSWLR